MSQNFTKFIAQIKKSICKKRSNQIEFYNKEIKSFDQRVWHYVFEHFNFDAVQAVVVAGPGFPKHRFLEKLKKISQFENNTEICKVFNRNIEKFFEVQAGSVL